MRTLILGTLCLALASACGSADTNSEGSAPTTTDTVTGETVIRRVASASCVKVQACIPSGFATAYGTVENCINRAIVDAEKKYDLSKPTSCSNEQVDACAKVISDATCAELNADAVPACKDC